MIVITPQMPIGMTERYDMNLVIPSDKRILESSIAELQQDARREVDEIFHLYYAKNIPIEKVRKRTLRDLAKIYFERKNHTINKRQWFGIHQ